MAWHREKGSGSDRATSKHDWMNKTTSFITSQHVATVAVNAGGTGYTLGDVLVLPHAGAHLEAQFEVDGVSAGVITSLRLLSSGAYGDRLSGTITVNAGGTGYPVSSSTVVLEVQGGTSRCPAKVLATTNGSGVVTSAALFEDLGTGGGGVYSALPSFPAATSAVGPNGVTGSGCTLTFASSTGLVGTSGLSVTGGTGSGATVNITLAETGWTVDQRNTNNRSQNSVTNEKSVTFVGDAVGSTNKPIFTLTSATVTSGVNTRHHVCITGHVHHNPALRVDEQFNKSTNGVTSATGMTDGAGFLLFPQNAGSEIDFWLQVSDSHVQGVTQIDDAAGSADNAIYYHWYAGFGNRFGLESDSPFPMLVGASASTQNQDPKVTSTNISSLHECRHATPGAWQVYNAVTAAWVILQNNNAASSAAFDDIVLPAGLGNTNTSGVGATIPYIVITPGTGFTYPASIGKLDRTSPTRLLRKVPGSTDKFFLWPLTVQLKAANTVDATNDRVLLQPKQVAIVSPDDGTGARITNFAEDYVTDADGARWRAFHNHANTQAYQYFALKEA